MVFLVVPVRLGAWAPYDLEAFTYVLAKAVMPEHLCSPLAMQDIGTSTCCNSLCLHTLCMLLVSSGCFSECSPSQCLTACSIFIIIIRPEMVGSPSSRIRPEASLLGTSDSCPEGNLYHFCYYRYCYYHNHRCMLVGD